MTTSISGINNTPTPQRRNSGVGKAILGLGLLGGGVYAADAFYKTNFGKKATDNTWQYLKDAGKELWDGIVKLFGKTKVAIQNSPEAAKNLFEEGKQGVTEGSSKFVQWIQKLPKPLQIVGGVSAGLIILTPIIRAFTKPHSSKESPKNEDMVDRILKQNGF